MKHACFGLLALTMLLFYQVGCDKSADAITMQPDGSTEVVYELPNERAPLAEPTPAPAPNASTRIEPAAEEVPIAPTYIVIQNADPTDPQLLVRQLQQVLPKTQVVKQVQSPNPREIMLEVSNIKDVRALANLIPFGSVESVDDRTRTITVDFDL